MDTEIMFQAWKRDATVGGRIGSWYDHLHDRVVPHLVEAGFTHAWLPPASKGREQDHHGYGVMDYYDVGEHRQWVQRWDEREKRLAWDQHPGVETRWGTRNQLERLLRACHYGGIACLFDVVLDRRAPQQVNEWDEWASWGSEEHVIASGKAVWGYKARTDAPASVAYSPGWTGEGDGEDGFGVDVAHGSYEAKNDLKVWLAWLRDVIGVDGFRYAFATRLEPEVVAEYNYHTGNMFSVVDYRDTDPQAIYDFIDRTDSHRIECKAAAFDVPLWLHLSAIFRGHRPFSELGLWKYASVSIAGGWPAKAVTFLEDHETGRAGPRQCFPTDRKRLLQGYAFLLTHPGLPCVFFSHFVECGVMAQLKNLCHLRRKQHITRTSSSEVLLAESDGYAALIDDRTIVKIGESLWVPSERGFKLALSGEGWAVWTR